MNRYGEPWRVSVQESDDTLVLGSDGMERAWCGGDTYYVDDIGTANRIAACVNACAGLTDEQLAGGVVAVESVKRMAALSAPLAALPAIPNPLTAEMVEQALRSIDGIAAEIDNYAGAMQAGAIGGVDAERLAAWAAELRSAVLPPAQDDGRGERTP